MKTRKSAFIKSVLALLVCFTMLIVTTFAWFTDSVTSSKNIITAGNLDLEMYWTDDLDSGVWYNVEDPNHNTIFSYNNWEPGYTDVKYIKLVNKGSLALNYELAITPEGSVGKLAEVINVFYGEGEVALDDRADLSGLSAIGLLNNVLNGASTAKGTLLPAGKTDIIHPAGEVVMTFAMNMITSAGNEYMNKSSGDFTITALATQAVYESDFFGNDYDTDAEMPTILKSKKITVSVTPDNGKVPAGGVAMQDGTVSAFIPEGVKLEDGADKLTLTITPLEDTTSGIVAFENEMLMPVDIHIDGVAADNTVPMIINLGAIMPKYLNIGNYEYIHVENGVNKVMTLVDSEADLTAHNQFYYDPATGNTGVSMASFSEVAMYASFSREWSGADDYSWYDSNKTEFEIANADQLYAFAKLVGGMANGYARDTFEGKNVTLVADINLNGGNVIDAKGVKRVFYPIGYYNEAGVDVTVYDRADTEGVTLKESFVSGVYSFKGTFDGNGHMIYNFYQNTWDMFGDYNDGYPAGSNYYKDAMGLFGYVNGGTVMNLTIDKFSSDGEFTPTGVVAAYACDSTFKNIAITNCNPRVYNTGNGGIVGIGGNSDDPDTYKLTFDNITIDNTNVITALWGSWDVACGGLIGMFRGAGHVHMTNCHVGAQIDVFNDVCGNYQYYWYRYSGILIGTNKNMTTDEKGYTVPETDKFHAAGCTVNFGDWNDYYYCELVANSLASYTHDHQFSRLTQVDTIDLDKMTYTVDGAEYDIPKSGRCNYVIVNGTASTENATCYHFVDGKIWEHEDAGYEEFDLDGNDQLDDLKENNAHIYLPFNQLFTGYGWGVKHIPIYDNEEDNEFAGVSILKRDADSVEKFNTLYDDYESVEQGIKYNITDLFEAKTDLDTSLAVTEASHVYVTVKALDYSAAVVPGGLFTPGESSWTDGTIKFSNTGRVMVIIQDYQYCTPTVLILNVVGENEIIGGDEWD